MRDSAILVGLTLACAALAACPAALDDRCSGGACDPGGKADGGDLDGDATAPDATVPPDCVEDADASAPEAKACMDDDFAFFVDAAGGKDTNDGTKAKPFKSIGAAVKLVPTKGKRRIYICGAGPYPEHLKLTTAVNLFGGFACADWAPDAAVKPKVAPSDAGYALHIDGVAAGLRVEDVGFEAIAGTADAPSSIAVFVANSPTVVFKRVEMNARSGFTSPPGEVGTMGTPNQDPKGNDGQATAGGAARVCTCSFGGSTTGGKGGDTSGTDSGGTNGLPSILPPEPGTATGAGSTRAECEAGTGTGRRGSDASPAPAQTKATIGILTATGWVEGSGAKGANGTPGQGGGGGGSYTIGAAGQNGGGGGGGCGGCGGSGGDGGKGGGASIALLAFNAPVRLMASTLISSNAGDGATGKDGGPGASGGSRGQGGNDACDGANGGNGGKGGAGAGGAGGVSAAALYKDGIPVNEGSTLKHGTRGTHGAGGKSPDNDGPDGLEGELVAAP